MTAIDSFTRRGILGAARRVLGGAKFRYHVWANRQAPIYQSPTDQELTQIERDLQQLGAAVFDYAPHMPGFEAFKKAAGFPLDYHGGMQSGVWDEKLLEHWISSELLGLTGYGPDDVYVDVAACTSPWAKLVRERLGKQAFALDLQLGKDFSALPYYRVENATATSFADASVRGASLHCAYEMFMGDDDIGLIRELARILKPGGKAVILPLYMHTHYCAYATPEFYGKGFADPRAKEYVRVDCRGVRSSRKYDAKLLRTRTLNTIEACGMTYKLHALRNKQALGQGIYCHFILEITR